MSITVECIKKCIMKNIEESNPSFTKHLEIFRYDESNTDYLNNLKVTIKKIPIVSSIIKWPYKFVMIPLHFYELFENFHRMYDEFNVQRNFINLIADKCNTIEGKIFEFNKYLNLKSEKIDKERFNIDRVSVFDESDKT